MQSQFCRVNRKVVKVKEYKQSVLRLRLPRARVLQECLLKTILKGTWNQTYLNRQLHQKIQEIKTKRTEMTIGIEIVSYINIIYMVDFVYFS